jgi:hypothetical protein
LPEHCELISRNIKNNKLENKVGLFPMGGADIVSAFEMTTNASKFPRRISSICMPIDSTLNEPVSIIKIDVEGMEEYVLKGLGLTLRRDAPDIYVECLTVTQLRNVTEILHCYGSIKDRADLGLDLTHKFYVNSGVDYLVTEGK